MPDLKPTIPKQSIDQSSSVETLESSTSDLSSSSTSSSPACTDPRLKRWKNMRFKFNSFSEHTINISQEGKGKPVTTDAAIATHLRKKHDKQLEQRVDLERDLADSGLRSPRFEAWSSARDQPWSPLQVFRDGPPRDSKEKVRRTSTDLDPTDWSGRIGVSG